MSECSDCKNNATIECCNKSLCEQCIGTHLMQIAIIKHRPTQLNPTFDNSITQAIHTKLANEILELGEFKTFSLQIINDFIQSIEKEVLEISETMNQIINDKADEVEQELRTALSHLMVKDSQNIILSIFKACISSEDVKNIKLVGKKLSCMPVNAGEIVKNSIDFSLNLEYLENKENTLKITEIESNLVQGSEKLNMTQFPSPRTYDSLRSQRTSSATFDQQTFNRIRAQQFPKPQYPNIYNFIPLTNKIAFYNPVEDLSNELLIDSNIFPSKAV